MSKRLVVVVAYTRALQARQNFDVDSSFLPKCGVVPWIDAVHSLKKF